MDFTEAVKRLEEALAKMPPEARAKMNVYRQKCMKVFDDKTLSNDEKTAKIYELKAEQDEILRKDILKNGNKAT